MLTDAKITRTAPADKPIKLRDDRGLYLILRPSGARWWRWDYRFRGKRKTLSFGVYPEVRLADARDRRDDARRILRDGLDPSVERKTARADRSIVGPVTFQHVLDAWVHSRSHLIAAATAEKQAGLIARYVEPTVGPLPVKDVTAPVVLAIIHPLDRAGRHETAHAVKRIIGQVLRYAVATGRAERDSTQDLRGAIAPVKHRHHPSVTSPAKVAALLRAIHADDGGSAVISIALKMAPLVFVRPGELRGAEWAEIDWHAKLWRIPAHRMKARSPHLVPLAKQTLDLLKQLKPLTGFGRYLFPSIRSTAVPMSDNTLNAALRRLGYDSATQTAHGFRSIASTLMNEKGEDRELVELQLAHKDPNAARAAYNRAERIRDRAALMQRWADYLDELRESGRPV